VIARRLRVAAAVGAAAVCLGGCGFGGIYSLPLPGAAGTGSNTYKITVDFTDVLDLVPFSAVKVNGATMGHVTKIDVENGHAVVSCQISNDAKLPANATAQIEETSLLGEKFVELEPPALAPEGRLADGGHIGLAQTSRDATVEEVLGALSTLLNGGGVEQINTIARELNSALDGRTGVSRDLLHQLDVFAAGLDDQKAQIIRAIQGVDILAKTVRAQENTLVSTVERVPPALQVLTRDRKDLTTMLVSVKHLGHVAVNVENASQRDLLANLADLRPTLDKLSRVGNVIPKTLEILITYPTADSVENEYAGDYGNLSLTLDLKGKSLALLLAGSQLPASATSPNAKAPTGSALAQLLKQALP
jgi:phospholipid/cholesterol/gamma-HCH transport system substrate-binding protein